MSYLFLLLFSLFLFYILTIGDNLATKRRCGEIKKNRRLLVEVVNLNEMSPIQFTKLTMFKTVQNSVRNYLPLQDPNLSLLTYRLLILVGWNKFARIQKYTLWDKNRKNVHDIVIEKDNGFYVKWAPSKWTEKHYSKGTNNTNSKTIFLASVPFHVRVSKYRTWFW